MNEDVVSLSEYASPLGRRFRALKLWATLRCFGREGLQAIIREHVRLAALFERVGGGRAGLGALRAAAASRSSASGGTGATSANEAIMERVNDSGEIFLSHTKLDGRFVLRLAIGNARTTEADVALAWDVLRREAARSRALGHDRPARRERLDQCARPRRRRRRSRPHRCRRRRAARTGRPACRVTTASASSIRPGTTVPAVDRGLLAGDVEADPRVRGVRGDRRPQRLLEPARRRLEVVRGRAEVRGAPSGRARASTGPSAAPVSVSS